MGDQPRKPWNPLIINELAQHPPHGPPAKQRSTMMPWTLKLKETWQQNWYDMHGWIPLTRNRYKKPYKASLRTYQRKSIGNWPIH